MSFLRRKFAAHAAVIPRFFYFFFKKKELLKIEKINFNAVSIQIKRLKKMIVDNAVFGEYSRRIKTKLTFKKIVARSKILLFDKAIHVLTVNWKAMKVIFVVML